MTQREQNPYPFSDSNKRYYTFDHFLRQTFGGKCFRVPLDAGFTCPNIDGTCGTGGCIYCSPRGSGDFSASPLLPLRQQFDICRARLHRKWPDARYIAYFQAHTNTYGPLAALIRNFEEALSFPDVVALNIATRADALPPDVVSYLAELADKTYLTVELGLQSAYDDTARRINRGHTLRDFVDGYSRLRAASDKIRLCVHVIDGLPGEDADRMLGTMRFVAALRPDQVKIHMLHVLQNTRLGALYEEEPFPLLTLQEYTDIVVEQLALLPPGTVIARLTGDGAAADLLAPTWTKKKFCVINEIDKKMYRERRFQGDRYDPSVSLDALLPTFCADR